MNPSQPRLLGLSLRKQRLRLTWVLAPLYLLFAKPSSFLLLAGVLFSVPGLLLRAFAAGTIHKDRSLAVTGPYARLRHPLYLGTFILGLGLVMAGGRWAFLPLFLGVFIWTYGRTIVAEERGLEDRFGEPYRHYRGEVSSFLPRIRPYHPVGLDQTAVSGENPPPAGFRPWLYFRNKEWATAVGVLAAFALLWLKSLSYR